MVVLGHHPNETDELNFYRSCQIDPLFDIKYAPQVTEALNNKWLGPHMGGSWCSLVDPDDRIFYFQKDDKDDEGTAAHGEGAQRNLTWEHPRIPDLRDEIQDNIAADEKKEKEMLKALEVSSCFVSSCFVSPATTYL